MDIAFGNQLALRAKNWHLRAGLWGMVGIAFLLQPSLTLASALFLAWSQPSGKPSLVGVLVLGALYIALVNVTKLPENDLAAYFEAVKDAKTLNLSTFLLLHTREPLYYVVLYGLTNLTDLDGRAYIFLSSLVSYLVFGTAVLRLGRALKLQRRSILSLLIFLFFFTFLFNLSAHLLRQFLAASLLMLFLADHAVTGRRRWGLGLLGVMIHYSSLPLLLLSLVKPFKRFSGLSSFWLHVLVLLVIYLLMILAAPLLVDLPLLGIVFQRIASGEEGGQESLTMPILCMAAFFMVISLYSLVHTTTQAFGVQDRTVHFCMITVCGIVLMYGAQPSISEIPLRYFFYVYFLMFLTLVFLMARVPITSVFVHLMALLSIPLFFYNLAFGQWTFAPVLSILFGPAWILWGHQTVIL